MNLHNQHHQSPVRRAVHLALARGFGDGHYGTRASYLARWKDFEHFLRSAQVRDPRNIRRDHVIDYAMHLVTRVNDNTLAISTAVNRLSCVNVVLRNIKGHNGFYIAPKDVLPARQYEREIVPGGLDISHVIDACAYLDDRGQESIAIIVLAMRVFGLRLREAILQNYSRMHAECNHGYVCVVEGTKNGRGKFVERRVPIDPTIALLIERAAELQKGHRCLIPIGVSLKTMLGRVRRHYNVARGLFGLGKPHDLRAAYACDRYEVITGFPAPVVAGKRLASKEVDRQARLRISDELGHGRASVCRSYLGGVK